MIRVKNKFIVAFLASALTISSVSVVVPKNTNIVYAAESKALRDAKAKIDHLTSSLKTNYLGLKNQGTWQLYIKQARELINKIPNSEKSKRDALTAEVNKDEALVNALARINQVEKSIQPKSEGGYGNYLGIKNAETWREYLKLAEGDLGKVDRSVFKKQYDELISRMNKVSLVVKDIEDKFQVEYDKVVKLHEEAKTSGDLKKAEEALKEAEKLGTCDRSDRLEKDIKKLINQDDDIQIVTFTDKNLEEAIRDIIGKSSGDIYKSDTDKITKINLEDKRIKDINGIESLTNLQEVDLGYNQIRDIGPLENLFKLQKLELGINEIEDISSLENLVNLDYLILTGNKVNDISALKNLRKLQLLHLHGNEISDISLLKELSQLKELYIGENKISDISSLKYLTNLETLSMWNNDIRDIGSLEGLTKLKALEIGGNEIINLNSLQGLTNLQALYIEGCKISDITPLENLTDLRILYLDENEVSDISVLKNLTNLKNLSIWNNKVSDISPLKNLTNLETLDLQKNQISKSDIQELQEFLPNCQLIDM